MLSATLALLTTSQRQFIESMSHLVVDVSDPDRRIKESSDSEYDSKRLLRQAPRYVNKVVRSDKKIDRELLLLYRAKNAKNTVKRELPPDLDRLNQNTTIVSEL